MKILCEEQYDLTWWKLRRGKPTASNAAKIVTPAKMKYSASARKLIYDLIGELYDPSYPNADGVQTAAMRNGTEREEPARKNFAFVTGHQVKEVGLCSDQVGEEGEDDYKAPTFWGSPDGIIVDTGEPLEIKAPTPGVHIQYLWDNKVPNDYIGQLHAHMLVCGTTSAWFVSYCPGFPDLIIHYQATEYLGALKAALPKFHKEYNEVFEKIKEQAGEPPELVIPEDPEPQQEEGNEVVVF